MEVFRSYQGKTSFAPQRDQLRYSSLAPTQLGQLERCQNRVLRVIDKELKATPLEALKMEVGLNASLSTGHRGV